MPSFSLRARLVPHLLTATLLLALGLGAAAAFAAMPSLDSNGGASPAWTGNDDMLLFYEALVRIQEQSIQEDTPREIVRKAIRGYLHQVDDFSDYLSPEEYASWRGVRQGGYAGVGMDIFTDRAGRMICLPYPGGPAAQAGIRYGDELTFVGREAVQGVSVRVVGSWVRGRVGESVSLAVRRADGSVQSLSLARKEMNLDELVVERDGPFPRIRIYGFGPETARRLREALAGLPAGTPRIIDLRGNTGGDLYGAIDAAALFLPAGATIVDVRTRKENKHFAASEPAADRSPVVIWQDGLTASAAEVFVAALVENGRAASVGRTTYGKGVTQTVIELSDGSALFVTNGALRTPKGQYYHRHGLKPVRELASSGGSFEGVLADTVSLWNATLETLGK